MAPKKDTRREKWLAEHESDDGSYAEAVYQGLKDMDWAVILSNEDTKKVVLKTLKQSGTGQGEMVDWAEFLMKQPPNDLADVLAWALNERAGGTVVLPGARKSAREIDPRLTSRAKQGIRKALFENEDFKALLIEAGHMNQAEAIGAGEAAVSEEENIRQSIQGIIELGAFSDKMAKAMEDGGATSSEILATAKEELAKMMAAKKGAKAKA